MHFIQFFFLVSDGSSDSGPPVSPPRARKSEYSSTSTSYETHHNVRLTDPIDDLDAHNIYPSHIVTYIFYSFYKIKKSIFSLF